MPKATRLRNFARRTGGGSYELSAQVCKVGLMGAVATSVHRHGGRVIGVSPEHVRTVELAYELSDELVVTRDMRERKAVMESRSDAFVALPGGFGTLEEVLEIITLKQLRRHAKPVVFLNTANFFDPLLAMFEQLYRERFTKDAHRHTYHVAAQPEDVFEFLANHKPAPVEPKWF
ncbi:MAG: TIGR00730 family Rossman fold protein [Verrucomicrobia bacterium]|nr:TIGR00730 family Rossman fold protein [Verrucomicrobiota bacterium]